MSSLKRDILRAAIVTAALSPALAAFFYWLHTGRSILAAL